MKQYRITSEHFVPQGETGEADTVMDPADLRELKRLAGIPITEAEAGVYVGGNTPQAAEAGIVSPVGSNISWTAAERNLLVKECQAEWRCKPGDPLWMLIMFEKPGLKHHSLRDAVEAFKKTHPKEKLPPTKLPGVPA
jgi:hypothetical protein